MAGGTVVGEVVYKVSLDRSDFDSGIKGVESSVQSMGKTTGNATKQASAGLDGLKTSIAGVVAAAASLHTVASGISTVTDAYNQYQSAMNGVKAVASATGNSVSESMQAIKEATANGLLSESDAAIAVKNLELYGYTAQQAGQMIKVLTDAATYNRQANYTLSEAVRVSTEGIRMENSVLSDAAGIQKNIAKMYDEYARQIGSTASELTQAEKAQAVYNGVMEEGGIFAGNAEEATNSLAGAQAKLDNEITKVQQALGSMFESFAPVISGIAEFIGSHRALVGAFAATVAVIVGAGGVIAAIKTLAVVINSALGPIGLLLTALGVVAGVATGAYIDSLTDVSKTTDTASKDTATMAKEVKNLGTASNNSAKQMAKLQKQIGDVYDDYRKDLKKIKDRHEETIADLTKQIEDANIDYKRAVDERNAAFATTEDEEKRKHQDKVDTLTNQLNFLQRYNNKYNQEKLAQVQFALQKEQALYEKETADRKAELDIQNAADQASLNQRLQMAQKELDDELNFMNKHRNELNSVRDVILLDEIEALKERRDKQLANLQEQITDNATAGNDAGAAFRNAYVNQLSQIPDQTKNVGKDAGTNLSEGLVVGVAKHLSQGGIVGDIWRALLGDSAYRQLTGQKITGKRSEPVGGGRGGSWAEGGYTGRGNAYEVAGIVHKGEFVLPQEMVDQTTGTPKLGQTVNITVNASGIMAVTEQEKRRVGMELANAVSQVFNARRLA